MPEPVVAKAKSELPAPTSDEDRQAAAQFDRMKAHFASRPKVSIRTRNDEWVQVNGYTLIIKAGERVEVPDEIATLLEESGRI